MHTRPVYYGEDGSLLVQARITTNSTTSGHNILYV